jgi:signal transduction histidine kinase
MENSNHQLRFFSNVTAGISHEINNVLSVIKENTGLMEDLFLMAAKQGVSLPYDDRIMKSLSVIRDTIKRGALITSDLNTFSHIPDHDRKSVKIHELLEMVSRFNSRKASKSGIQITVLKSEGSGDPEFMTMPVLLSRLFHLVVSMLLDLAENGGEIKINWIMNGDGMRVLFNSAIPVPVSTDRIKGHVSYNDILGACADLQADMSVSEGLINISISPV